MQTVSEANLQAQATWNNRACGLRSQEDLSLIAQRAFYRTISQRRYGQDDPWVPDVLDFPSMRDKQVLEIGYGMGCDLATAALNGAIAHGIDLTPNHYNIARQTMTDAGVAADLHLGNAGELPFPSGSMDIVYSLGVLHHTDNIERCVAEVRRVLRPGGTFIMSLYHFWSLPHLWLLILSTKNGNLRRLGYRDLLSTVEAGADGVTIRPLVKLYSQHTVRKLLADFSKARTSICGLAFDRIPVIGPSIPNSMGKMMERRWGWYVVARATK